MEYRARLIMVFMLAAPMCGSCGESYNELVEKACRAVVECTYSYNLCYISLTEQYILSRECLEDLATVKCLAISDFPTIPDLASCQNPCEEVFKDCADGNNCDSSVCRGSNLELCVVGVEY